MDRWPLGVGVGVSLLGAAAVLGVGALRPVSTPVFPPSVAADVPVNEVTAEGGRFAVGRPGDVVVVADWACSQHPTAAVLRPSTGGLFVFDGWPATGATSTVRVHTEPGATTLSPGDGCGRAELGHPDGSRHIVVVAP